jgi:YidC/Oxa1 family membrane protein insertase
MAEFFTTTIYQPIFNLFVWSYNLVGDVGVAILLITILFQLLLYPLNNKSIRAQKALSDMQPELEKLKKEHKGDQQKLATETMRLYREHKVNPFGSCLPVLVQIPIFLALFYVFKNAFEQTTFDLLYPFVANPGSIDPMMFGVFNLAGTSAILALLAGGAQFIQTKMLTTKRPPVIAGEGARDESMAAMMNKQMLYMMPILTVIIGLQFPAGVVLYWFFRTVLAALQQWILFRKTSKKDGDDSVIEGKIVS